MLRLYTFTISHFSEKARWAMEHAKIDFEEKRLLPGPHLFTIKRLAKKSSVPVLVHDAAVIQGSSAVLDYVQHTLGALQLAPPKGREEDASALEARTDRAFGAGIQTILYDVLLHDPSKVVDLWTQGGPFWGRAFYAVAFGAITKNLVRMYKIRPPHVDQAKDLFRKTMDETDRLIENRPYFFGDTPCRVDFGIAALLAPICRPPEHLLQWPELSEEAANVCNEFAGRPTWDFTLRMYREHRKC